MTYSMSTYLIDIHLIQNLRRSNNHTMIPKIKRHVLSKAEHDEFFDDEYFQGALDALQEIMRGDIQSTPETVHFYVYALEYFCDVQGIALKAEQFQSLRPAGIPVITEFEGLQPLNTCSRSPIAFPGLALLPSITYILPQEAPAILQKGQGATPTREQREAGVWYQEAKQVYEAWLSLAILLKKTLICFLY